MAREGSGVSAASLPILTDAHAPDQGLVCCHGYGLSGVSGSNGFIGVRGAHQLPKLQDLVTWTDETDEWLKSAVMRFYWAMRHFKSHGYIIQTVSFIIHAHLYLWLSIIQQYATALFGRMWSAAIGVPPPWITGRVVLHDFAVCYSKATERTPTPRLLECQRIPQLPPAGTVTTESNQAFCLVGLRPLRVNSTFVEWSI